MNHQAGAPRPGSASPELTFDGFRAVVGAMAEIPVGQVAEDSDLLHLGFDSIRLMRLAGWLRRRGAGVRFADLARCSTVGEWWEAVRGRGAEAPPPVQHRVDDAEPFDLAVMQHAFWIGRGENQRLGGVAAHFYTEFDASSGLDAGRLEPAVRALFERHGMLRVRVGADGRQRIGGEPNWPGLRVHDLRGLAHAEAERRLAGIREELSHRIMDLASGEVFDIRLSLLHGGATRMHVNLDMVAADALSLRVLLADLAALCGPDAALPPIGYSYPRYRADRAAAGRDAHERAAAWWRERLPHLPGPPALPAASDGEAGGRPTVARRHHWLAPDARQRLRERAHQRGLTPAAALAAAFAEVVARWSTADRFLLNLPVFDREPLHDDVDKLVGDFSGSVLLDIDTAAPLPFAARTAQVQKDLREAMGHVAYTGVEVLRDLTRANGGEPVLAPVVFTSALELGELFAPEVRDRFGQPSWIISQGPQVWLDAQATELDGGLLVNWDARESVFPPGVLDAMFEAFVDLVEALVADGSAWDAPVPRELPPDQRLVRDRVNATGATGGAGPLHERFFGLAAAQPDRVALVWGTAGPESATGSMSYGELSLRARRVAGLLAARGVGPGDTVGITLPKGPEQVVAVLGVLAAGAAYVPSGIDVPMARRARVYRAGGAALVLTDAERAGEPDWPEGVTPVPVADALRHAPLPSAVGVDAESVMYVLFTSGSTGVPKGVEVPHRAVANTVDAVNSEFEVNGTDRTVALSALDFDLSAYDLFAFLSRGGSVVVLEESQRRDARAWAQLIRYWGVTVVSCVPALLDMLLTAGAEHLPSSPLRLVMLGGDWVTVDLPGRLRALVPGCRFAGLGGMTEAAIHSTVFEVDEVDPSWRAVPYGRPLRGTRCRVAGSQGEDRPDWVPGELWVSGTGVALGYRGDPERTAEKFVEHEGRRWYRTGDLARYRPDGTLEFLGRRDHQVKIRGHRIELGEIESHLAAHPQVGKAIAAVVERATRQLAAAVVLNSPAEPESLREWLGERVPGYMVPEHIRAVDSFPVTKNGKIDRAAISAALAETGEDPAGGFEPPDGEAEEAVAALWRELLGARQVGRGDSFFALGGDSLLATRLMGRLRESGVRGAELARLFETPVLAEFAAGLRAGADEAAPALKPDPEHRYEPFPLTEVQHAYWLGRSTGLALGGVPAIFRVEFDGAGVDLDRLRQAWDRLIARHDMLRAVIGDDGRQRVLPEVPPLAIEVATAESPDPAYLHGWTSEPGRWPLFDVRAVRYGQDRTRLAISLDAMVFDALSVHLLLDELARLYTDPETRLPDIGVTFRDYVVGAAPEPGERAAAESYWRERLPELPPGPRLPLAAEPAAVQPRFTRREGRLDTARWSRIKERARTAGLTPSVLLLECYARVLSRWSGQADLTVNLTLFDRRPVHPDLGRVLGDFTTLLPVEHRSAGDEGWLAAAHRLQARLGRDLEHRSVSSIWVQRELARGAGAPAAAFPVVFTSTLGLGEEPFSRLPEAFPRWVGGASQTPQVWLDHQLFEHGGGLNLVWDAVDGLFPPGVLDAMFSAYQDLLAWLSGEEDWSARPPVALPGGQRVVREGVNATAGPEPEAVAGGGLLHGAFFARAAEAPERAALLWDGGELTYGALAGRALRVAGWLVGRGVRPGDAVAICLPKGPEQVAAVLGVLAAGGVYVPVGVDQPPLRRERLVEGSGAAVVLDDLAEAAGCEPLAELVAVEPEALAYVIFTSGSTGEPKGVEVPHRSAANTVDDVNTRFGVGGGDRVLAVSALDFDLSVYDVFGLLSVGGAVVLIGEDERRDAQRWRELVHRHGVTVWNTVPALLDMLVTVAETGGGLPGALRLVLVSGDWVGLDLPGRLRALAPQCRFVALGGATEASIWSNAYDVTAMDGDVAALASIPYGYPLRNQRFRVVDALGRDCPDWVAGELWIGGTGVAAGYRGDPERSAAKFVEYGGGRWYRTGDLGRYWPDGTLEFLGRVDTQVKVRGHRIELGEVEAALAAHPAVAQAVCVAPGERNRKRLAAFVQPFGDLDGLAAFLAQRLPAHAVPGQITAVDAFPLTANGKVDRAVLTDRATETAADDDGTFEAPVGTVERELAELWGELLGAARVGRRDGFFALGGDSLLATRLVNRLREAGLAGARLANLFATPTLAEFAATLTLGKSAESTVLRPAPEHRHEPFPLTDVQQAYWLGRREEFVLGGIGAQFYVEYEYADLDVERLEEAWNRLVARHDMLRAVVDGTQRVLAEVPRYRIAVADVGQDPAAFLEQTRERMSRQVLDAGTWPLFDIVALRYDGDGGLRLCVVLDNLIADGLSILTLFAEWERLYADPDAELPPVGVSFRDYVLQAAPEEEALDKALAYWRHRTADLPPGPRLPVRVDPRAIETPRFERREIRLDPVTWQKITDRARQHAITPSVVLLTCYAEVLAAWSGQAELTVNLTLFDRRDVHPDINRVVGDFTSVLLVAHRPERHEGWLERARRLQEQVWRDLDHQDVSGVRVLRELAHENDSLAEPVPVVFTSMLGVDDTLARSVRWPDHTRSQTPQVWLDHQAIELPDGLLLSWDSVDELFPDGLVDTMFAAYEATLRRLAREQDWHTPVADVLPGGQRVVREGVNATAGPEPEAVAGGGLLHGAFFARAAEAPERAALLWDGGELTYGALAERALRVAGWLVGRGVRPGDAVVVSLAKGPEQVAAVLGVLAAGGVYVPVGVDQPPLRRERLVEGSGAAVVLDGLTEAAGCEPLAGPVAVEPEALAYVIFTSGSTGEPKGVEITHRGAVNTVDDVNTRFGVGGGDRVLAVSALDFDLSVYDVFGLLSVGGAVVLIGEDERRDAQRWRELVHRHGVTVWNTVPALLDMLVTVAETSRGLPGALRLVLVSGDWVGLDLPGRLRALVPQCRFVALGGATEASIWSNAFEVEGIEPGWASVPYGLPLRNQRFRVVDEWGRDCPDWVAGELWIGGTGVAAGYRGDPERSAAKFVEYSGGRWYRTGDLGRYWPDGTLEFLGRVDTQVKVRGHRIELGEVEAALAAHPAVAQAVCVAPGERDRKRLAAFISLVASSGESGGGDRRRAEESSGSGSGGDRRAVCESSPATTAVVGSQRPRSGAGDYARETRSPEPSRSPLPPQGPGSERNPPAVVAGAADAAPGSLKSTVAAEESSKLHRRSPETRNGAFIQVDGGGEDLAAFLAQRLPAHAVPGQIAAVDAFPLTANGKIDRAELTDRASGADAEARSYEPPRGAAEETVAALWGDLLGAARVGRRDGFFALGGDSLLATRLVNRLREAGLAGARLANLFATPALADFAATLTPGHAEAEPVIRPAPDHRHEPFPLTDVQQAYWLGRREEFVLGGIGAQFYVEYEYTDPDLNRLEEAWNRIISRHDMLRAVVDADGTQRVLAEVPRYRLPVTDFTGTSAGEAAAAMEEIRESMSRQVLDAATWPLFDILAIRHEDGGLRLCVVLDNLIVDGLSMLTLFAEWGRLYADPDAELAPVGVSFRDYVLQAQPDPERLAAAEAYWRERAAELPPGPRLPVRLEPDQVAVPRFQRREAAFGSATWRAITERAKRHELTPSVVLLACYAEVLAAGSGQGELTVNLTLFDRRDVHPDINRVVGDFTSLLLVAHRLDIGDSWLARVRRLQEQVWRDLDHQEMSGVRVLRELARENDSLTEAVPVVFTSMLGVDDAVARSLRWPDHARSQTPQVWLDHQAVELADGVLLSWDSVDELFPDGLVDAMFGAYVALVQRLAEADWAEPVASVVPPELAEVRERVPPAAEADERTRTRASGTADADGQGAPPAGPPRGDLERELAALWGEILGRVPAGRTDNFFALGGDSLSGTRMIQAAARRYGADVPLRAFFAAPTVADLARVIDERLTASDTLEDGTI